MVDNRSDKKKKEDIDRAIVKFNEWAERLDALDRDHVPLSDVPKEELEQRMKELAEYYKELEDEQ